MTREQREAELQALLLTEQGRAEIVDRYLKLKEEKPIRFNQLLAMNGVRVSTLIQPLLEAEFGPDPEAT